MPPYFVIYRHRQQYSGLMPYPSASSKIFWLCINFSDLVHYLLNTCNFFRPWSKVIFYLINLHILAWSNIFEHIQKYWTLSKNFECKQKYFWTSRWIRHIRCLLQVNLCQKHLFLVLLTHNMTKDCSMIYQFSTWKLQAYA